MLVKGVKSNFYLYCVHAWNEAVRACMCANILLLTWWMLKTEVTVIYIHFHLIKPIIVPLLMDLLHFFYKALLHMPFHEFIFYSLGHTIVYIFVSFWSFSYLSSMHLQICSYHLLCNYVSVQNETKKNSLVFPSIESLFSSFISSPVQHPPFARRENSVKYSKAKPS